MVIRKQCRSLPGLQDDVSCEGIRKGVSRSIEHRFYPIALAVLLEVGLIGAIDLHVQGLQESSGLRRQDDHMDVVHKRVRMQTKEGGWEEW